jgi:hypothetical protein
VLNLRQKLFDNRIMERTAVKNREILKENNWYSAYHFPTNRMLNVKFIGTAIAGIQFEDREKRVYSNREFYFWKATE